MKSTNIYLRKLVSFLHKQKAPCWKAVAEELAKPTRRRREVNLTRINAHTKAGEIAIVPGKVLGTGELEHKVVVSAWRFSDGAFEKIRKAGGEAVSLEEMAKKNPQGKGVKIIG